MSELGIGTPFQGFQIFIVSINPNCLHTEKVILQERYESGARKSDSLAKYKVLFLPGFAFRFKLLLGYENTPEREAGRQSPCDTDEAVISQAQRVL